ncbi:hypothetical protein TNCV_2911741 [Trichonephila clavipes]|nr:hypothetical protein TNCV_2911741 [Trichonephila clavipes]
MNVPLPTSIASCVEIQSVMVFGRALQPRNPISSSLPLTVLGHALTFDVKVHCFKICEELSFLFESNNLSSCKDVFLGHPDLPLSAIKFVSENLFKVLTTVERPHGTLAAIWRIE